MGAANTWRALKCSVKGHSHGTMQDYCDYWASPRGDVVVAAVADGHGGARYFRSDRGARFAVEVALDLAGMPFGRPPARGQGLLAVTHVPGSEHAWLKKGLSESIAREWRERVRADLRSEPLRPEEVATLAEGRDLAPEQRELMPYGSTLLLAITHSASVGYLQVGDGDILELGGASGDVYCPLSHDPALVANETHSLCSFVENPRRKALDEPSWDYRPWEHARSLFRPTSDESPAPLLILLATDGYSNSFKDYAGFEQIARDYAAHLQEPGGRSSVEGSLETWLAETSREGSGDDISVVLIYDESRFGCMGRFAATSHDESDIDPSGRVPEQGPEHA